MHNESHRRPKPGVKQAKTSIPTHNDMKAIVEQLQRGLQTDSGVGACHHSHTFLCGIHAWWFASPWCVGVSVCLQSVCLR
jgi:hypothetical protein